MKKLNDDTKRSMRVISTAKEYIRGKEVAELKLNGRQIKNGNAEMFLHKFQIHDADLFFAM
jgi:hypothetical protein